MPKCVKCDRIFANKLKLDGKTYNLQRRKYCIECSPFKNHNTKKLELENHTEKECTNCKIKKLKSEFYKKRNSYYSECKECFNKRTVKNITGRKKKILDALNIHACQLCSYSKCIGALEFHHIDPNTKVKYVTPHRVGFEKALEEAKKCMVLCANCHREEHERLRLGEIE